MDMDLELNDFEKNLVYTIKVSREDRDRAIIDNQFANSLLFHARIMNRISGSNDKGPSEIVLNEAGGTSSTSNFPEGLDDDDESLNDIEAICENVSRESLPSCSNTKIMNIWSYQQTTQLISSMASYYPDFNDPRQRKHIFEHIANDLISAGFEVNDQMVMRKWKSLLRSYNKAKDNKNRTGRGPSKFLFYESIDEVVGNQPKNKCDHSLNSLDVTVENEGSQSVPEEINDIDDNGVEEEHGCEEINRTVNQNGEKNAVSPEKKKRRLSDKQIKKEYVEMKKKEYEKRQKRHDDKMKIETERNELERRKVMLLEKYLSGKE
ncbi:unnamed protein product [Psylliodes chrysocephalus]|uniref:Myb/SANT-like DNA-binding domain-containing protein n=1 Tax=Psylliodes chrysocephalus TaxID=3402493 RepID=A0A9P0G8C0_9CUCU|nr:unnamed protein product [Psylliodes chrysocephala]